MSRLSHKQKLYIIVGIAAVAVVLQYLLHLKLYAQILVTLVGAIIALSMFKEMVHTLRSGKYGRRPISHLSCCRHFIRR